MIASLRRTVCGLLQSVLDWRENRRLNALSRQRLADYLDIGASEQQAKMWTFDRHRRDIHRKGRG